VGSEFGIKNAVFPAVVAGDDDRASFAYIGTPTGGNYQDIDNFHGVWHIYVSTTYDGDLHGRHHLWGRPQPARLHGRHHRQAWTG
jgi:hypothetical protein